MSNELNKLEKLRTISASVRDLEQAVKRLAAFRNEMIRELRKEGESCIDIATASGMHRARVYQVTGENDPEVDVVEVALMLEREATRLDGNEHAVSYQEWLTEFVAVSLVPDAA